MTNCKYGRILNIFCIKNDDRKIKMPYLCTQKKTKSYLKYG